MNEIAHQQPRELTPAEKLIERVREDRFLEQIKMALPANVPVHRFVRATVTALLTNPELANAEANSLFQSIIKAAQDGLLPDGREAALVIYKTKVRNDQGAEIEIPKAQYLPMVGGFRKIAGEQEWTISTKVVYANDHFEHEEGLEQRLVHKPAALDGDRGKPIGAYAIGRHRDGRTMFEVYTEADIAKARRMSRARKGPWDDWTDKMWEKTVGRRLFKKLPLGERDAARVSRVLDATAIEPGEAAAAFYGPAERTPIQSPASRPLPQRSIEAGASTPPPDEAAADDPDTAGTAGGEGQQDAPAGDSPSPGGDGGPHDPSPEPAGASPGTDDEEPRLPELEAEQQTLQPVSESAAKEAGKATVPAGRSGYAGKRLDEIAKTQDARKWFAYAITKGADYWQDDGFLAHLATFVAARYPDLTAEAA